MTAASASQRYNATTQTTQDGPFPGVIVNIGGTDHKLLFSTIVDQSAVAVDFATQTTLAALLAKFASGTVIGDVNLGATDNAVLDAIAASAASIDTKTPALGQAIAAASVPVVLTAAQLTTLTPPAAITGFATESTLSSLNGKVTAVNTGAVVLAAGTAAFGKLAANDGVDIGDVTINNGTGGSAVNIQDGGNSITVDGTFWQATQPVSLASVPSHAVTNAGTFVVQENGAALTALQSLDSKITSCNTASITGTVGVDSIVPGTQATSLGKAEDQAHVSGDVGVMALGVRKDTPVATAADGDYQPFIFDSSGRLHTASAAAQSGTWNIQTVSTVTSVSNVDFVADVQTVDAVTLVSAILGGNTAHDGAAGSVKPLLIGAYASSTAPSDVSANNDAVRLWALRNGSMVCNLAVGGTLVTASAGLPVDGGVAHDGADSGSPHKIGARATNVDIAAVSAANDRTDLVATLTGKLITHPWSNPENFVSGAITSAMTGTTSTSLISAPASGLRNYITQITVSNSHATVGTDVIIQDGNGGTTLYTIPAAANYGGAVINFPVPLRQPTAATAIYCANVTTGSSIKVSASGYKAA